MPPALVAQILESAHNRGFSQKDLAALSGIAEETISRIKKRGSGNLDLVERLALAAGTKIGLVENLPAQSDKTAKTFRDKYAVALAWSNTAAPDNVLLRRALLNPRFQILMDAALEFGPDKLTAEWERLKAEDLPAVAKVERVTERILGHIHDGYLQATT